MSHTNRITTNTTTTTNATNHGHPKHAEHVEHAAQDLSTATAPREQKAYDVMLPRARALPVDQIANVNLDVPTVVSTVVAVARRMLPYRAFVARLPDFDVAALDELESVALALAVAHADFRAATSPDALADVVDRGTALRASFQIWGDALVNAGLFDRATRDALGGGGNTGYRDLAIGLVSWVRALHAADWTKIKAASVLTDATLAEAEALSQRVLAIVGTRELTPEKSNAASDVRARMYTLAINHYDAIQRAATYMRWAHDDVDEFAPSLFAKGSHHAPSKASSPTPAAPSASAGAGANAPSAANAPSVTGTANGANGATTPAIEHVGPVGTPDSSPFTK